MLMAPAFSDLLVASTREVMETMSFMDLIQLPLLSEGTILETMQVTASVCLAGEVSGMLSLHCSQDFARQCCEMISGEEMPEISEEKMRDTVGELANMIAGSLKRHLSSHVDLFYISIPHVLTSTGHKVAHTGEKENFPRLLIPFALEDEQAVFYADLVYHKR